jgi:multiple sugar transport system ATP-binding protein
MNLLEATVDDGGLRVGRFRLPLPAAAGPQLHACDRVVVGVRPEYAELAAGERPGAIAGEVALLESLGSAFLVSVEGDGVRAQVTVPEGRQPAVGDHAFLVPDPERLLVYRKDDGELVGAEGNGGRIAHLDRNLHLRVQAELAVRVDRMMTLV